MCLGTWARLARSARSRTRRPQLRGRTLRDDTARFHDDDLVELLQQMHSMHRRDDARIRKLGEQSRIDLRFGARIEMRRRFVEQDDAAAASSEYATSQRDAAALTA